MPGTLLPQPATGTYGVGVPRPWPPTPCCRDLHRGHSILPPHSTCPPCPRSWDLVACQDVPTKGLTHEDPVQPFPMAPHGSRGHHPSQATQLHGRPVLATCPAAASRPLLSPLITLLPWQLLLKSTHQMQMHGPATWPPAKSTRATSTSESCPNHLGGAHRLHTQAWPVL